MRLNYTLSNWGCAVLTHSVLLGEAGIGLCAVAPDSPLDAEPAWHVPVFLHQLKQLTRCFLQRGPLVMTHVFVSLQAHAALSPHCLFLYFFFLKKICILFPNWSASYSMNPFHITRKDCCLHICPSHIHQRSFHSTDSFSVPQYFAVSSPSSSSLTKNDFSPQCSLNFFPTPFVSPVPASVVALQTLHSNCRSGSRLFLLLWH